MLTKSHLKPSTQELLFAGFVNDLTATQAGKIAKVNRNTANKWYWLIREMIFESNKVAPRFIGTVEMDCSAFGRRRTQKKKKRLYRRGLSYGMMGIGFGPGKGKGTKPLDALRVFGILQRGKGKKSSVVYARGISKEDIKTLLPITHLVVDEKATIFTDNHRSFDNLYKSGYKHGIINKSGRVSWWSNSKSKKGIKKIGVNGIENFWSLCKRLDKFKGISRSTFPLHIKECEFRFNHRHDLEKALRNLLG